MQKRYIHILILVIFISLLNQDVYADSSSINKSSETESTGIDSGFVILDERYIKPPYIISCRDSKIYINDIEIPKPVRHPGEKYAFENKDIQNLSGPDQKKLSKILEIAPEVYKSYLEKGEILIFSSKGGYETINLYTGIYRPSDYIEMIRNSQPEFAKRLDSLFDSLLYIEEFNIEKSQPIDSGFVFVDCRYLDTPYVIERRGLALFINDNLIQAPFGWPQPNYDNASINITDPNQPLSINEYSCLYDPDVINYLSMKSAYLREHYPIEEAVVQIRDAYRNLPCIKQAQLDPNDIVLLHVEWTDGSDGNRRLIPINGRPSIKMDKESILERLEKICKNYEERLQKGDYYFLGVQNNGHVSGDSGNTIEILTKIVPILRSSKSPDTKLTELEEANLPFDYDFNKTLINNFSASPQLEARLNEFGITEGKPINDGVVFLDGKYIESPCTITREGLNLFVNGKKIERPSRHPGLKQITEETNANQLSEENRQKIFRALEAARNIYETNLEKGCGYLFFSQGGHIKLSPYTVAYDLPDIMKILTSNKTKANKLTELKPYNWHLFADIELLIDNFVPSIQLISKIEQKAEDLLKIDEYGTNEVSVNNGFVFYKGEYLESPYVVKRKGLGVFINDKMIVRPLEIPNQSYSGDIVPEFPPEINSESSIYDEVVSAYLMKKFTYLKEIKAELEIYENVIRNLPFVVEAETDPNNPAILNCTTTEGLYIPMSLVPFGDRGVKYDKSSVIKRVEDQRVNLQNNLSSGICYIISSRSGTTSGYIAKKTLAALINILRSQRPEKEKFIEIEKLRINISENTIREIINNFKVSSQLQIRLSE